MKTMKMNKILGGAALATALLAAGCKPFTGTDFDGTDPDYSANEKRVTAASDTSNDYHVAKSNVTSISMTVGDSGDLSSSSIVTVTISSTTRLRESTFDSAISFYTLKENTTNSTFYPIRTTELAKTRKDVHASVNSGSVTTIIEYELANPAAITSNYIAMLVRATELRDAQGNYAINEDGNGSAGDETDNVVKYGDVSTMSNGTPPTTTLTWNSSYYDENWAPTWTYSALMSSPSLVDTDSNGRLVYSVSGSYLTSSSTTAYKTDLAALLNTMYVMQYKVPGSSDWVTDTAFTWAWNAADTAYKATTSAYTAGTKYRIKKTIPAKSEAYSESSHAQIMYGHTSYLSYYSSDRVSYIGGTNGYYTSTYYSANPDYIVTNSSTTFPTTISSNPASMQQGLVTVTPYSQTGGIYWVVILNNTATDKFNAVDGFIVTNSSNVKVPATAKKITDSTVHVSLDNTNLTDDDNDYSLWVGSGTTLSSSAYNSTKFGTYADASNGDASGYVKLN